MSSIRQGSSCMRMNDNLFDKVKDNSLSLFFITSISVAFFSLINIQLLSVGFYSHINIAFDFDQAWFFETLAYSSEEWKYKAAQEAPPLLIKHPFLYLYRFPSELLQIIGVNPEVSVLVLSLIFHTGTLVLSYFIFLNILESSPKATLLTLFMMLSSTFIVNGIVLDTYVLAGFWITCCYALYLKEITSGKLEVNWLKILVYVMAVGTTTYLLLLVILLESSLIWNKKAKHNNKEMVSYLTQGAMKFTALFFIMFCLCYYQTIMEILSNPIDVIKRTLWAVARPGEKEGIMSIMGTFLVHTFVAPFHSVVEIEKGVYMADFRNGGFHLTAYVSMIALVVLYLLAFRNRSPLLFASIIWLVITMLFHIEYQDRGSLFLYTGHTMLALSTIIAYGLKSINLKRVWVLITFVMLTIAYNNLQSVFLTIQSVILI